MKPSDLCFPPQFEEFRPAQLESAEFALTTDKRFVGLGLPPGVGKSALAFMLARLLGGRTVVLTSTLGLQSQYSESFGGHGLVNIQGRGNYPCWSSGTCEDGNRLGCKEKEACPYLCAFRAQDASNIVVTSFAYWLAVHEKGKGLREADTLILDEAGLAPEWLSRALDFYITEKDLRSCGIKIKAPGEEHGVWIGLAERIGNGAGAWHTHLKYQVAAAWAARDRLSRDIRKAERLMDAAAKLSQLDDNWVVSRFDGEDEGRLWRFECVWPGRYRENLFRGVERVILMSATLRPKLFGLLGVKRSEADFKEWGRQFPAKNGPVVWIPTARVTHRISAEDERRWLDRHKEIVEAHPNTKGLIHTVSYARSKRISEDLGLNGRLILNGAADPETATARESFERHCRSPKPTILCSPSFSTGWDFKDDRARWQIIAKIPLPDTRSKVMQARLDKDSAYSDYVAGQDLVQACGRVVRSEDDWGETLLIDDSWNWFGRKAVDHLPKWFKVRREDQLPPPMRE